MQLILMFTWFIVVLRAEQIAAKFGLSYRDTNLMFIGLMIGFFVGTLSDILKNPQDIFHYITLVVTSLAVVIFYKRLDK